MSNFVDRYPQAYQEWVQAGGIENNFRKHALAIGLQKPTIADLDFLQDETIIDVRQIVSMMHPFAPAHLHLA